MRSTKLIAAASLLAMLCGVPAMGQNVLELTGTLRDFNDTHSDFENHANWQFPLITGMVQQTLGPDGRPMLNVNTVTNADDPLDRAVIYVTFSPMPTPTSAYITSTKDLSNVVLKLSNGVEYKYDNLTCGQSATFAVPQEQAGATLVGCWVKSGRNASGDGPGYGELMWVPVDENSPGVVIPAQWRIASVASFTQWYNNVTDVNQSIKHTITLTDPDGDGVYRYEASKHNGQSFFPLDGLLFGNQGRPHNYHFTYNIHTKFTYTDPATREPMTFTFSGDDDVWVYINKKLVVDLGGVHAEQYANVNVDTIAAQIGMEPGKTYDFDFFFAERHTTESNFTIETSIQFLSPLYD